MVGPGAAFMLLWDTGTGCLMSAPRPPPSPGGGPGGECRPGEGPVHPSARGPWGQRSPGWARTSCLLPLWPALQPWAGPSKECSVQAGLALRRRWTRPAASREKGSHKNSEQCQGTGLPNANPTLLAVPAGHCPGPRPAWLLCPFAVIVVLFWGRA